MTVPGLQSETVKLDCSSSAPPGRVQQIKSISRGCWVVACIQTALLPAPSFVIFQLLNSAGAPGGRLDSAISNTYGARVATLKLLKLCTGALLELAFNLSSTAPFSKSTLSKKWYLFVYAPSSIPVPPL